MGRIRGASIGRIVGRIAGACLLASLLLALFVLMLLPRLTQSTAMTVVTGSMTPEIPVGSIVLVRAVDPASLQVNDIATYSAPDAEAFITHRIVEIDTRADGRWFIFKGDANHKRDVRPVPEDAIAGEVWFHVPFLGGIRDALQGKAGLSLLAMLVLGGYAVVQIGGAIRDRRGGRAHSTHHTFVAIEPLVIAQFSSREQVSLMASELHGTLLAETQSGLTVIVAPPADQLEATLDTIRRFDPSMCDVLASQVTLVVGSVERPPMSPLSSERNYAAT